MASRVGEIFEDEALVTLVKNKLPLLFRIAELECSRAGKIGMEVGIVRERILAGLLIYKFGEDNVETQIPTTESEVDVKVFGQPVSIKTATGEIGGMKAVWTVDAEKALEFARVYNPLCDVLYAHIKWNYTADRPGGLFFIPLETQRRAITQLGKENYLRLPKQGTNPRGVDLSREAVRLLLNDTDTKCIPIEWKRPEMTYDPYKRGVDYWRE